MALNPQYEAIGKAFTQSYYAIFDNVQGRNQLLSLYHVSNPIILATATPLPLLTTLVIKPLIFSQPTESLMSFEGQQCQGAQKIIEKFNVSSIIIL